MNNFLKSLSATVLVSCLAVVANAGGIQWFNNLAEGQKQSALQGKPIFLLLTGHGWCGHCDKMEREVILDGRFSATVADKYIFVELDYNFDDSIQDQKRKTEIDQLRQQILAPSFPNVVLLDKHARQYAMMKGYDTEQGLEGVLAWLSKSETANTRFSELVEKAAVCESDTLKASLLDQALDTIAISLGDAQERENDPILMFYSGIVNQIFDATKRMGPVAEKYLALQKRRDLILARVEQSRLIDEFSAKGDSQGAIKYIKRQLEQETDVIRRRYWKSCLQSFLQSDGQYAEALELVRFRLKERDWDDDMQHAVLCTREAMYEYMLGNVDRSIALYDQYISDFAHKPECQLVILDWRSQRFYGKDPVERSITYFSEYRNALRKKTEDWLNASALLARELARAGKTNEAVELWSEVLVDFSDCFVLMEIAKLHKAANRSDMALRVLEQAIQINDRKKTSVRRHEQAEYASNAAAIAELKDSIEAK